MAQQETIDTAMNKDWNSNRSLAEVYVYQEQPSAIALTNEMTTETLER